MIIKANYYSLTPRRFIAGTKNSYGIETVNFIFSSEWDGLAKTVTFFPVNGSPVEVIYGEEPVNIPAEVMAHEGLALYTLCGRKDNKTLISVTGYIDVLDAKLPGGEHPVEPTPDEMAQVLDMMNTAVETANSVRRDADLGLFKGEKGEKGDKGDSGEVSEESVALRYSSFLAFSSDAYFESDTENSLFFVKFSTLTVRGSIAQTIGWDKSFSAVAEACGLSPVTSTKGVSGCLAIPDGYVISYCMADDTIKYGHCSDAAIKSSKNIVVIAQSKGRFVDGLPNALFFMTEAANGNSESAEDTVPTYWESALSAATEKIKEHQNAGGADSFTFGFITDTHRKYYLNGVFASLMKRVLGTCDIPVFFLAGDLVDGAANVPKDEQIADIKHHKKIFKSVEDKMLQALGNHDSVFGVNDLYDGGFTDGETYNYIFRDNESKNGIVRGDTGRYFYRDLPAQKVRYIVLDSHAFDTVIGENSVVTSGNKLNKARFGAKQLMWLGEAINVPSGYSVVLCSHVPPYRESDLAAIGWTDMRIEDSDVAVGILNAYINGNTYSYSGEIDGETYNISLNFTNRVGEIVCWVAGHTHKDNIFDLDGLKVVNTVNCSLHRSLIPEGYAPLKTSGTDTEFAMDFICVNKATKDCHVVRLGACLEGSETRSFNYNRFNFTINGKTYQADFGMTWGEWVESDYNNENNAEIWTTDKHGRIIDNGMGETAVLKGTRYIYTTDAVMAGFEYSASSIIKTFTLNDTTGDVESSGSTATFNFKDGMTWGEWKESEYNTVGFRTYEENAKGDTIPVMNDFESTYLGVFYNGAGTPVQDDDIIYEGDEKYYLANADDYTSAVYTARIECGQGSSEFEFKEGQTLADINVFNYDGERLYCPVCGSEMSESPATKPKEGYGYYCSTY